MTGRFRLCSLWISQVARSAADFCLRVSIVLQISQYGLDETGVWLVCLPFFTAPSILLAPVNGALINRFPKKGILVGAAVFCLCTTAVIAVVASGPGDLLTACLGLALVGTGQAVYSSARYAALPAAAQDCGWPLNRVMGWMEAGEAFAAILGLRLA